MEQTCVACGKSKTLDAFPKTKSKTTGKEYRRHRCKACEEKVRATWRRANPERVAAMRKKWRDTSLVHKANRKMKHKIWRDKNREHIRQRSKENALKRFYGLTPEDIRSRLEAQGNVCAACGGPPLDDRPLMVDHDHTTGAVREMLCNSCNLTLGVSREDTDRLCRLILYLEKWKT